MASLYKHGKTSKGRNFNSKARIKILSGQISNFDPFCGVNVKPGLWTVDWTGLDWTDDHYLHELGLTFSASMDLADSQPLLYQTDIDIR